MIDLFDWNTHGDEVQSWYKDHGLGDMQREAYPDDGYIIPGLAALWVFDAANAKVSWIAYQIINPKKVALGVNALSRLTDFAEGVAKEGGSTVMFQSLGRTALERIADLKNYNAGDTGMTHYWKRL